MFRLGESLRALEPMRCDGERYIHSTFATRLLGEKLTVYEWLYGPYQSDLRDIRLLIIVLFRKGPYIDELLAARVHTCDRTWNNQVVSLANTSVAGAAYCSGCLVSLYGCVDFPTGPVEVLYSEGNAPGRVISIRHIVDSADAQAISRRYEPNPKHDDFPNQGVRGTRMDLRPEEAQQVLHCGLQFEDDKRVFAQHNKRIYVFNPHRQEANLFHGYPVDSRELRRRQVDIYNRLRNLGWVD
ncbi:MAG: hypothetical protein MI924_34915 [Chloroflexales bacterium]|nr:hypothetical protein [Chloroflexales bacterium]